jgi:hypothetical protein
LHQLARSIIDQYQIARRESAIDDGDEVSSAVFIRIPDTALRLLAIASSVDDEGALNFSIGWRGADADSDRGDSGTDAIFCRIGSIYAAPASRSRGKPPG